MSAQNTEALGVKAQEDMLKKERRANNVWNKLKRNKTAMIGLFIVLFMVFIAIFAPIITNVDPDEIHPLDTFLTPGQNGHIFGTDEFGRDLFAGYSMVHVFPSSLQWAAPLLQVSSGSCWGW